MGQRCFCVSSILKVASTRLSRPGPSSNLPLHSLSICLDLAMKTGERFRFGGDAYRVTAKGLQHAEPLSPEQCSRSGGTVIRQAISCDICGAEKKQTNHWFVATEQAGELRVSAWSSQKRLRIGTKHLCGQTCIHKLLDEFTARMVSGRVALPVADSGIAQPSHPGTDASLTSTAAYEEIQHPVALLQPSAPVHPPKILPARPAVVVPIQAQAQPFIPSEVPRTTLPLIPVEEVPQYASRRWCADAWERERLRGARTTDRYADNDRRRKGL